MYIPDIWHVPWGRSGCPRVGAPWVSHTAQTFFPLQRDILLSSGAEHRIRELLWMGLSWWLGSGLKMRVSFGSLLRLEGIKWENEVWPKLCRQAQVSTGHTSAGSQHDDPSQETWSPSMQSYLEYLTTSTSAFNTYFFIGSGFQPQSPHTMARKLSMKCVNLFLKIIHV